MGKNGDVQKITLDAKAGEVSAELVRRGIAADARVHTLIEVVGEDADLPLMAVVAEAGGAFDWLADEPELYTDADLPRPLDAMQKNTRTVQRSITFGRGGH